MDFDEIVMVRWLTGGMRPLWDVLRFLCPMIKQEEPQPDGRLRGVVKWFDDKKGYGFLTGPPGGKDVFVHFSSIVAEGYRSLVEGTKVEFEMDEALPPGKGPRAAKVVILGGAPPGMPTEWNRKKSERELHQSGCSNAQFRR